jgi:hypothetical protein
MNKLTSSRRFASFAAVQTLDAVQALPPEWLRLPAAMRVSSLSRNVILARLKDGILEGKHYVSNENNKKGVWFIRFQSLMNHMNSLPDATEYLNRPACKDAEVRID